ncbi:MAG: hypothetical protein EHM23_16270 [Acidobacteria bacterium]|nr:MAG: hypothetical protein EHM23_16270 [Acidobacteriota bacterium]
MGRSAYGRVTVVLRRPVLVTSCFLFIGTWLLLSAAAPGHFFVADEMCYFYMAQNFVDHGKFDVPSREVDVNVRQAQLGKDGRYYAPHSFGHSFYLVPWVGVGRLFQWLLETPWAPVFAFSFAHSLTISLTWTLFFLILVSYGISTRAALVFALASVVSTLALPYARSLFAEPLLALSLTGAWLAFRKRGDGWFVCALIGALALAFSVTVRPTTAVLLPGFWLLALQQAGASQSGLETPVASGKWRVASGKWQVRRYGAPGIVMSISLAGLVLFGLYNYVRFGSVLTIGYPPLSTGQPQGFNTPIWFGMAVFLASPGKAVWLFCPLLVLSAVGYRRLWKVERTTAVFVAWVFLSNLVLHSLWTQPEGGFCWGPRFFVGVLPVLLLPAALIWHWSHSPSVRYGMGGLVLLGLVVQGIGISVNYSGVLLFESMLPKEASKAVYYSAPERYNLAFSPFPAHIDKLAGIISEGNPLALRHPLVRAASDRSTTHSFPFWWDTLDVWAVHLVKDGYRVSRVFAIELLLIFSGLLSLVCAFRAARTPGPGDDTSPPRSADEVAFAPVDEPVETCSDYPGRIS